MKWTATTENGDHSAPAVTTSSVYVSFVCPWSYAFTPATGALQWLYSPGDCSGGGGKTAVYHQGKLYVRGLEGIDANGVILNATNGANIGTFKSDRPPAFVGNLGLYLSAGTLTGVDITTGNVLWSFTGDGGLQTAPLVVNTTVYVGSSTGMLYGVGLDGNQVWSVQVGAAIPAPDEHNFVLTTGLGAGDGLLAVPTASTLSVYASAFATPTPTPTATPTPTPTATPTATPTPTPTATPGNYAVTVSASPAGYGSCVWRREIQLRHG